MSLRSTVILTLLAAVVGIIVYVNPFANEEDKSGPPLWFYQVAVDDMESIAIDFRGNQIGFVKTELGGWSFVEPSAITPDPRRWGGVVWLLGGPQTRRDLSGTGIIVENPAEYGLDDPDMVVTLGLTVDRSLEFRLGNYTTDGRHHYAQVVGFPELFLIASSWGDIFSRLVTEPPYPKWYIKRDINSIDSLTLYLECPVDDRPAQLNFKKTDGNWSVIDYRIDNEKKTVDRDRWNDILPLLGGPPDVSVAMSLVEGEDFSPWGISDCGRSIEIRFRGLTDRGTTFSDGILLLVGNKTDDGKWYYGTSDESSASQPILLLESKWTDTLFELFDDVPVANES